MLQHFFSLHNQMPVLRLRLNSMPKKLTRLVVERLGNASIAFVAQRHEPAQVMSERVTVTNFFSWLHTHGCLILKINIHTGHLISKSCAPGSITSWAFPVKLSALGVVSDAMFHCVLSAIINC